jgi:hypothetical protein
MNNHNISTESDLFFNEWEKQIKDVSFILDFLHTYPKVLIQLKFEDVISSSELFNSQKDWIRICSKYRGMEKDFFKTYWVPIQKSSLSYFIDISNPKYPVFKYGFVSFEPYSYQRINLFDSIEELMLLGDSDINIEGITNEYKDRWFEFYCRKSYEKKKN